MKLVLLLTLCALAAAAPKVDKPSVVEHALKDTEENRSWIVDQAVNQLIRALILYIRGIVNNGSAIFGIPPLDPLEIEHFHLKIPAGLINLDLELDKIFATGIGGFVVHRSRLDLTDLSFDIDVSVPTFDVSAEQYDLLGDLFTAIPIYGKGGAIFKVEEFRFQAKLYLVQSEDGDSVLIGKIENADFQIPKLKSEISGAIGGGNIDAIVNAIIEDVVMDYINRSRGVIAAAAENILPAAINPFLDQLDTWKYINALPRPRNTNV